MNLQLVSNFHSDGNIRSIQTHEIYEVDYYILVMDDIGKVNLIQTKCDKVPIYIERFVSFSLTNLCVIM